MTDVGIRSGLDQQYPLTQVLPVRATPPSYSPPRSLLPWDVLLAATVGAALVLAWEVVPPVVLAGLLAAWSCCLTLTRASGVMVLEGRTEPLRRVARAGAGLALAGTALSFVPSVPLTAGQAFAAAGLATVVSGGLRLVQAQVRQAGCVLVVGGAEECEHVLAALARRPDVPPVVTVAPTGDVAAVAQTVGARLVVAVPGAGLGPAELRRLRWALEERLPCYVTTGLVGVAPGRVATVDLGSVPLVGIDGIRRSGPAWVLTGWAGRVLAALALVVLAPLLAVLVVAIRRESPGPAIFRQTRVGRHGRTFTILKLRTMVAEPNPDAALVNECDGVLFKMRSDPRVTRLGCRLRKYSLDELPQLVNVVRGEMRLVGPRPALPAEVAEYTEDERRRLVMPPGITGLWQVSGRSDLSWGETVRLDLLYVDNWSPAQDLVILCRTFRAVLGHRGAY